MRAEPDPVRAILHVFPGLQKLLQDPPVEQGVAGYWLIPVRPETAPLAPTPQPFEPASIATPNPHLQPAHDPGQPSLGRDAPAPARPLLLLIAAGVVHFT